MLNLLNTGYENMQFEWGNPMAAIVLLLPAIVYFLFPVFKLKSTRLIAPFFERAVESFKLKPQKFSSVSKKKFWQWLFVSLTYISLTIALMNPKLVGKPHQEIKTTRTFIMATDISFSMKTKDWKDGHAMISRWEAIKSIMNDFIINRKSDKMGLVMFGTHAYMQTPPTNDLQLVNWMLQDADIGMAGQKTSIGEAIGYSMNMFKQDSIKEKVLLLMTDGVDTRKSISPIDASNIAKMDSVKIYTLGIGSSTDKSKLNEPILKQIASITGGKYFHANNIAELSKVYKTLDKLEPIKYKASVLRPEVLLYYYPALLALFFSLFGALIQLFNKNDN